MKRLTPAIIIALVAAVVLLFGLYTKERAIRYQPAPGNADSLLESTFRDQQKFEWKLVTSWPKNFPGLGTAPENIAKRVSAMTDGQVEIKIYAAGELVGAFEAFDAVSTGTADIYNGAEYY